MMVALVLEYPLKQMYLLEKSKYTQDMPFAQGLFCNPSRLFPSVFWAELCWNMYLKEVLVQDHQSSTGYTSRRSRVFCSFCEGKPKVAKPCLSEEWSPVRPHHGSVSHGLQLRLGISTHQCFVRSVHLEE